MIEKELDGLVVNIFRDEDHEWLAHFVEMPHISAFADTPDEAMEELKLAWELIKQDSLSESRSRGRATFLATLLNRACEVTRTRLLKTLAPIMSTSSSEV